MQIHRLFLVAALVFSFVQADGRTRRRRRQYSSPNFGGYVINPEVAGYYGMSGTGQFSGNGIESNRFIAGGSTYRFPTPVNVMSGGSYNPQEFNLFPNGIGSNYYDTVNNMRLPSQDGWYPLGYRPPYPIIQVYSTASSLKYLTIIHKTPLWIASVLFVCYNFFLK